MRRQTGAYGDRYYGWGGKLFYLWVQDSRGSALAGRKGWSLNCLGILGWSVTSTVSNLKERFKRKILSQ